MREVAKLNAYIFKKKRASNTTYALRFLFLFVEGLNFLLTLNMYIYIYLNDYDTPSISKEERNPGPLKQCNCT